MKNLDDKDSIVEHSVLIRRKPILYKIYKKFYTILSSASVPSGKKIELGSGGGFIKQFISNIITSDVILSDGIDKVFSATKIPYRDKTISAFYMIDTFHHIKNPRKALSEMSRCLKKGGKIIMIEPYNSVWGRFIYQNFHHENFDPNTDWKIMGHGRMSDANGAIPWIIFERDRKRFDKEFPNLVIKKFKPHTPFAYLLSGGLSKPQLIPTFTYPILEEFENFLKPLNRWLGMFVYIEIQKK